jgi:YjbE family integral membrane protein
MFNLADVFTPAGLTVLGQIIMIDLTLAGDNVVVLGTLAAGLSPAQRKRVLAIGVGIALVCLIGFALIATKLLHIVGLLFAGGLLLLWVAWKLFRELHPAKPEIDVPDGGGTSAVPPRSFGAAIVSVVVADLSMSLDNVLAVAGTARDHPSVLFIGLALSVALMAVAANFVAKIIERYRWIIYFGLVVILYVAMKMIYDGIVDPEVGLAIIFR